jgi:hypothetical protein
MFRIGERDFFYLNDELGYELVKRTIDGFSPYERGIQLYSYLNRNVELTEAQRSDREHVRLFAEMEVVRKLLQYRNEVGAPLLSPKQITFITTLVIRRLLE